MLKEQCSFEVRLFLEELVVHLSRFILSAPDDVDPQAISIRHEVCLGAPDLFADIMVAAPGEPPTIVEVNYGYDTELLLDSIRRKFGSPNPALDACSKLILVAERLDDEVERKVQSILPDRWTLDVWDNAVLQRMLKEYFDVAFNKFDPRHFHEVRDAIECAKGKYAFGADWSNDPLDATLLWHFGYWRLHQLYQSAGRDKRRILPPRRYDGALVLYADISGYSAFVRDTPDVRTVQNCLTSFCAKSRDQIINDGGMFYQFLGDCVVAVFGIPERQSDYVERAFRCANVLLEIMKSVSNEWQRRIDRVQPSLGGHIGIALGDLNMVPLRPFSSTRIGALGETINIAARLCAVAECDQIAVSNTVYRNLCRDTRVQLTATAPVQAKNMGLVRSWLFDRSSAPGYEIEPFGV